MCNGSLSGGIHVQVQRSTVVRLPSLKTLQIDVGYADVDYLNVFFSGCPILETLDLTFSPKFLNRVRVPRSLKRLKLTVENDVAAFLHVDAPGLKYLCITKVSLRYFGDLHNVVEADIATFSRSESPVALLRFLTALSGTKYLVLRLSTIKVKFCLLSCLYLCLCLYVYIYNYVNDHLCLYCISSGYLVPRVLIFQNFAIYFV